MKMDESEVDNTLWAARLVGFLAGVAIVGAFLLIVSWLIKWILGM